MIWYGVVLVIGAAVAWRSGSLLLTIVFAIAALACFANAVMKGPRR